MKFILALLFLAFVSSCATQTAVPPKNIQDICEIFREKPDWFETAHQSSSFWGIPLPVMMAVMHQESSFGRYAKPKHNTILWVIPWSRPSSAEGYSQALTGTWEDYKREGDNPRGSRTNFHDAIDFVGWYLNKSSKQTGVAANDARNLYLTYYYGAQGYNDRIHSALPASIEAAATRVQKLSERYQSQYKGCKKELLSNL